MIKLLPFLLLLCATMATAQVPAREKIAPVTPFKATLFPLENVRLLPSPFKKAMETDKAYLLRLDPNRLLSGMRESAGLPPKAPRYGGWDSGGSGMVGHYLSAVSQMAQATGDPAVRARVDYTVSEMAACQAAGKGGPYASPYDRDWFKDLASGKVRPQSTTPWYVAHKTFAGLRDAWLLCGNAQAKETLIGMADWCLAVTEKLTDAQWQEMMGLPGTMGEFGGPHEVLADVYAITGDRKYLTRAEKFRHAAVFDPLLHGDQTALNGRHANTEIPKFVGYERIYELTGDKEWHAASVNFWNDVTANRSWANGGNSQWEHFFAPGTAAKAMQEVCGPETCNTYNMLKLTRQLYTEAPSVPYMDYYERALYNHILSSEAPNTGGFVYYTSMRPGHYRVYSKDYDAFWCCVGTGMENHGKYGELIYAHQNNRLYVNLFIPSVLTWKERGLTLTQETRFPEEQKTRFTLTLTHPQQIALSLRCPGWVAPGAFQIKINGKIVKTEARPGAFVNLTRLWKSGDRIEMALPMRLHLESLAGATNYAAYFYGPLLLAGELGTEGLTRADFYGDGGGALAKKALPVNHFPVLVGTPAQALARIKPVPGKPLTFHTQNLAKPADVTLIPFYRLHFQRYALYWHLTDAKAYRRDQNKTDRETVDRHSLEARTLDFVLIGDAASEKAHALVSDHSNQGDAPTADYAHWRDATGSFSYDLKVIPAQSNALACAYWGGDAGRAFDILVDGVRIATQKLTGERPGDYVRVVYPLPQTLTQGKGKVTVQFVAHPGSTAGGVFDCRTIWGQ